MKQGEGKCETAQGQAQETKPERARDGAQQAQAHTEEHKHTHEKAAALEYHELVRWQIYLKTHP